MRGTGVDFGVDAPIIEAMRSSPATISKRSPGRARSDRSRRAILSAAIRLLETASIQDISIEAIADAAKVSKATIYRWWKSKASVIIEAFMDHHLVSTPMPRNVSAKEALTKHIGSLVDEYGHLGGRIVAQLIAEGQSNPDVLREFRERFWYGRRAVVREVLEQGRRAGELRGDLDIEFMMDILYAPIYFRLLMGHLPLDHEFAIRLPREMFKVISAEARHATATPDARERKSKRSARRSTGR